MAVGVRPLPFTLLPQNKIFVPCGDLYIYPVCGVNFHIVYFAPHQDHRHIFLVPAQSKLKGYGRCAQAVHSSILRALLYSTSTRTYYL